MKSRLSFLLLGCILVISQSNLNGQRCQNWSDPQPLSDSNSYNQNPSMAFIAKGQGSHYVFWDRVLDVFGSEIIYLDYYGNGGPETVVLAEGYSIKEPQVLSTANWWYPHSDSLAFIFYQTDQNGDQDIYYVIMTGQGFTEPVPLAATGEDESHCRINPGGGLTWQRGDDICYSRLRQTSSGFLFDPVIVIDTGDCRNPDMDNTYYDQPNFIAWEKGPEENPQVWYSEWSYENQAWGDPQVLYPDGDHTNIRFSNCLEMTGYASYLVSDARDPAGQYHISAYDMFWGDEFITDFTQSVPFQPDLFTVDLITQDFFGPAYFAFRHDEGMGNYDIYSSDYGDPGIGFNSYCGIDITPQSEYRPLFFEGAMGFDYVDLICIWESFRNGNRQLFSAKTWVVIGDVKDNPEANTGDYRVLPNPFSDFFWLELATDETSDACICLFNSLGHLIKKIDHCQLDKGNNLIKIEAGALPPGIYLVRLESGGHLKSLRVVKK